MRLIIFDVDGTLIDSQELIVAAQTRAFAAHGLPAPDRVTMLSIVGLSLDEAFTVLAGPEAPIAGLSDAYREAGLALRTDPAYADPLYPGADAAIRRLARTPDTMLGIATGKSNRGVVHLIEKAGWDGIFATTQTADDHPSKPDPSMIMRAMEETGVDPAQTCMIGDTSYDMGMARSAGVTAIGCLWGYHSHARLIEAGAQHIVRDFDALLALLGAAP